MCVSLRPCHRPGTIYRNRNKNRIISGVLSDIGIGKYRYRLIRLSGEIGIALVQVSVIIAIKFAMSQKNDAHCHFYSY